MSYIQVFMRVVVGLLWVTLVACGGGGGGSRSVEGDYQLSGYLRAPDGVTPIANATIYIQQDGVPRAFGAGVDTVSAVVCAAPDDVYVVYTCTDAQGAFRLDLGDLTGDRLQLVAVKGLFRYTQVLHADGEDISLGAIHLPATPAAGAPRIAVVSGNFDRMQDILAKLGMGAIDPDSYRLVLGSEQFDLYNGDHDFELDDYPPFAALFADEDDDGKADIYQYDIVFINCGNHFEFDYLGPDADQPMASVLRDYVAAGGVLYVTDQAYDFVEQAFPEYIDFLGSDGVPAAEPEDMGAAEEGSAGISVDAEVLDTQLGAWLDEVVCAGGACRDADGRVRVQGFLSNWAVIQGVHAAAAANVKTWVSGDVSWLTDTGVRPLTVSLAVGDGQVIYSAYHTEDELPSAGFHPQERVLQYLIFEAGSR